MGDDYNDREVVRQITSDKPDLFLKSIKFFQFPNVKIVKQQLELVAQSFSFIIEQNDSLDLQLTVSVMDSILPKNEKNDEDNDKQSNSLDKVVTNVPIIVTSQ